MTGYGASWWIRRTGVIVSCRTYLTRPAATRCRAAAVPAGTTPTLGFAAKAGCPITPREGWLYRGHSRFKEPWAARIRDGRAALRAAPDRDAAAEVEDRELADWCWLPSTLTTDEIEDWLGATRPCLLHLGAIRDTSIRGPRSRRGYRGLPDDRRRPPRACPG